MKLINLIEQDIVNFKNISKILKKFQNQDIEQNDIFKFEETLFEPTNKQKKFKCKFCHIEVNDLQSI